jgi:hypothetical protein
MASTFPNNLSILLILQLEFISRHKPDIVLIRENEVSSLFIIDVPIPSYLDICLGLRFFELFVIICLKFDQRLKDFLILLWVLVPQKDWLLKFFNYYFVEILKSRVSIIFPKFFEFAKLLRSHFSSSLNFLDIWFRHEPSLKLLIFYKRLPI